MKTFQKGVHSEGRKEANWSQELTNPESCRHFTENKDQESASVNLYEVRQTVLQMRWLSTRFYGYKEEVSAFLKTSVQTKWF